MATYLLSLMLLFQDALALTTNLPPTSTATSTTTASFSQTHVLISTMPSSSPAMTESWNNGSVPLLSSSGTSDYWTGPDWASFPTTYPHFEPLPSPEPTPRPITDRSVIQLVKTAQEQLLIQYDTLGTLGCFTQGNTYNCRGPWLRGGSWNNRSLSSRIFQNTVANPRWQCSSDQSYLSNKIRSFYGFTSDNITDSLQGIAHSASIFAAATCSFNTSCALTYRNDTSQMYYDFRHYVNATFFNLMTNMLVDNNTKSYCPDNIASAASIFTIPTTPFDGGKEYFGLHDAIFLPGVAGSLNGTIEEARKELKSLLGNNARKSEGVFLNMVFFTYGSPLGSSVGLHKRSDDDEVYPGCPRNTWIIDGKCEGVIPPREFDLAGSVLPMKERDRMEVLAKLSGGVETADLVARDFICDSMKQSIENSIDNFQIGKALFDEMATYAAGIATLAVAIEAMGGVAAMGGAATIGGAFVGGFGIAILMSVAACEAFETCDGFPPALKAVADEVSGKLKANAGLAAFLALIAKEGKLAEYVKPLTAGAGLGYLGLFATEKYVDYILTAAIKFNKDALACCGNDCLSAVCQQAARACLMFTGSYWAGSEKVGLNCAAT